MIAILSGGIQKTRASMLCSKAFIIGILSPFVLYNLYYLGDDRIYGVNAFAGLVFIIYMWAAAKDNYKDLLGRLNYNIKIKNEKETLKKQLEIEEELKTQKAISLHASKMVALGELAGNIAHEINNPLAIIRGKAIVIKRKNGEDKELVDKSIDDIEKTVTRMSNIISGLKKFSYSSEKRFLSILL